MRRVSSLAVVAGARVEVLKEESASISGGSHNRQLLSGLVVAQIALSLALLVSLRAVSANAAESLRWATRV